MSKILDGKKLAKEIELILQQTIESGLGGAKRPPGLAVIRVGNDSASYIDMRHQKAIHSSSHVTQLLSLVAPLKGGPADFWRGWEFLQSSHILGRFPLEI